MFEGLFQQMHLLVVLGIALLLFGPKKLPELGQGLGEGIRKFKSSLQDDGQDLVFEHSTDCSPSIKINRLQASGL